MTVEEKRKQIADDLLKKLAERRENSLCLEARLAKEKAEKAELRSFAKSVAEITGENPLDTYFDFLEIRNEKAKQTAIRRESERCNPKSVEYLRNTEGRAERKRQRQKDEETRQYLKKCRDLARLHPDAPFPSEMLIDLKHFDESSQLLKNNDMVAAYYQSLAAEPENLECEYITDPNSLREVREVPSRKLRNLAYSISHCASVWRGDFYQGEKLFDVKQIGFCHSRFCAGCQKKIADYRFGKYQGTLDELWNDYDLYHLTLTQPNVFGENLIDEIDRMFKGFQKLSRYFSLNAKLSNSLFSKLGFVGMFRSLELTIPHRGEFHPHFHIILVLKKGLEFSEKHVNVYSYDKSNPGKIRKYTDLEIMIQKIWYLLMNKQAVTQKAISKLELGYSCQCTKIEQKTDRKDYKEVFKYAIKPSKDERYSREDFYTIVKALKGRRSFQGYGVLFGIADDEDLNETDPAYDTYMGGVRERETPVPMVRTRGEVRQDIQKGIRVISRKYYNAADKEEAKNDGEDPDPVPGRGSDDGS